MLRRLMLTQAMQGGGGGQFYVYCNKYTSGDNYTFTIDSQKTWGECIGLKDDTGVTEISSYEEVAPGTYRIFICVDGFFLYAVESDEDGNTPTLEDKIKINTTYEAFLM